MNVIEKDTVVGIDVDDTLLMWDEPHIWSPDKVKIQYAGETIYLTPHKYHIAILKTYVERGYHVIVWSGNGKDHARRAVIALGLEKLDIQVMTKLCKHMDDNPNPASIVGPRIYEPDLLKQKTIEELVALVK